MRKEDAWPLGAVGFVLIVSVAWWSMALGSIPGAPEWLERARNVCFNITETGLPDRKGWLMLLGQPPLMLGFLFVGWGDSVRGSLGRLASIPKGRMAISGVVLLLLTGVSLAVTKVADARLPEISFGVDEAAPETYPRLDRDWPAAEGLQSQLGAFSLASLEGRRALVTFAFGHCATICPVVVHQARQVRSQLATDAQSRSGQLPVGWTADELAIVVFTLDPWRDTPNRLPGLVTQFELDPERDFLVSGSVDAVNAALDAWNMPRERDETTGDITHPGIVYMIEPDGTIAYGSTGGIAQMESLVRRLR